MFKKTKGVVLDSTTPIGIGVGEDAKARLKYQTLVQDYVELQKEADAMRSRLEASRERKLMLAAEVRFLRRRHKYLVKMKDTNSFEEQSPLQAPNSQKRARITKEQLLIGKEASQHRLPAAPLRDALPVSDHHRKKKSCGGKEARGESSSLICARVFDLNQKRIMHTRKEVVANDSSLRTFDLNQDTSPGEREASFPTRAPIFDLNEISTGDEDFQGNAEANTFEMLSNDLKLSVCRNAGEGSSSGGKRKISWQDPVALRV